MTPGMSMSAQPGSMWFGEYPSDAGSRVGYVPRFHQARLRGLVPKFRAIDDNVSPGRTTYVVNVGAGVGVGRTKDGLGETASPGVDVGAGSVPDEHAFEVSDVAQLGNGEVDGLGADPVATMMSATRATTTRTRTPAPIGVARTLRGRGLDGRGPGSYGSVMRAV